MVIGCIELVNRVNLPRFSRNLRSWFRTNQRELPWRDTKDPYTIFVSEIMLQQTRVATVLDYFTRFMEWFPTVQVLAAADEDEILAIWAGLGYYRRARLMHAAAKVVAVKHGGSFPRTAGELRELPGVGRYTASAILSFAYGLRAPIVEANSRRVLARLFALEGSLETSARTELLWRLAEQLLPRSCVRQHNYAMMELGSLVCRPVDPDCDRCPVAYACRARELGLTGRIPAAGAKPGRVPVFYAGVVVRNGAEFLVRRIGKGEWHEGLFEFPKVEVRQGSSSESQREALEGLLNPFCSIRDVARFADVRYTVTNHPVMLHVWIATAASNTVTLPSGHAFRWMSLDGIARLPLGSAQKKIVKRLAAQSDLGGEEL